LADPKKLFNSPGYSALQKQKKEANMLAYKQKGKRMQRNSKVMPRFSSEASSTGTTLLFSSEASSASGSL